MVICILGILTLVVGANVTYAVMTPTYWSVPIPVMNATYHELVLSEYRGAENVSYAELCAFLENDTTEMADYRYPDYTCGDFALHLQDAAELNGIDCGIVAVNLNTTDHITVIPEDNSSINRDKGHAFDVFNTTDRGIVYVDATGVTNAEKKKGKRPYKMAVYFEDGMPLGEILLNQSESFNYAYYQQREGQYILYMDNVSRFLDDLDSYNKAVQALNGTKNSTLAAKRQELIEIKHALGQREEAGWVITKPFGIVERAVAYW